MNWSWQLLDESAQLVDAQTITLEVPTFGAQADAETWIGETWEDLLEQGVDSVNLFDGDRLIYGPMSLNAQA